MYSAKHTALGRPCRVQGAVAEHAAFPGPSRHAAPQASGPSEIEERWSSSTHLSGITENQWHFRIHQFYTLSTSTSLNVKASCSFSHFYIFPFLELHALFHTVCPLTVSQYSNPYASVAFPPAAHLQDNPTSPLPHHSPAAAKLGAHDLGNKRPSFPVGSFQDFPRRSRAVFPPRELRLLH